MDAASALADLTEISSQIEAAAVIDADGEVIASTPDDGATDRLARAGVELLRLADERLAAAGRRPSHVEAALREASLFVVRGTDRSIVARTSPKPSSMLVLHDLAECLGGITVKPKRRRKATADA